MNDTPEKKSKKFKRPTLYFFSLLNPVRIFKAVRFHYGQKKYCKSNHDLELHLFSGMLSNDMLHFGYFEDINVEPEKLSFHDVESSQVRYAERLVSHIRNKELPLLDIGCGLGGIANMINLKGFKVEVLTPNIGQIHYVAEHYPEIPLHHFRFEDFQPGKKYGTLLNAESFQYINLKKAFIRANELIAPRGRWIISDYFSVQCVQGINQKYSFKDFEEMVYEYGWKIVFMEDITRNVLPTLKFANMYITRGVNPILLYLQKKLLVKMAWLHYLTHEMRESLVAKLAKEFSKVNPEIFLTQKKYMIIVMEKGD